MTGSSRMAVGDEFFPLSTTQSRTYLRPRPDEHVVDIPLSPIRSHNSTRSRTDEEYLPQMEMLHPETGLESIGNRSFGRRRRIRGPGGEDGGPRTLNKLGRFYEKLINFSIVTRYLIYIFPLSLVLAIPTLIGGFGPGRDSKIGGVRIVWFFLWVSYPHTAHQVRTSLTKCKDSNCLGITLGEQAVCKSSPLHLHGPCWSC